MGGVSPLTKTILSAREDLIDDEGYFDVVKARVLHGYKYPKPLYLLFGEVIEAT